MGATSSTQASADYLAAPLTNGFLQGYNTLDALAALTFGITVVAAIKGFKIKEGKETTWPWPRLVPSVLPASPSSTLSWLP